MSQSEGTREENTQNRDRWAMILMLVAALGALYALVTGFGTATSSSPEIQQVEWWRVFGFLMFAGLFVLLAFWPRRYPFLWELLILDKALLTIAEVVLIGNQAKDAVSTAEADGILTVILVAAYVLSKGYRSWWRG